MADGDDREIDALLQNPILQDINGTVSHFLSQLSNTSKETVIGNLVTDVELDAIVECRELLSKNVCVVYDEFLEEKGHPSGRARLELKLRRGETAAEKSACDIVELFLYVCGFVGSFPRDVLSSCSTYIDIELQSAGQTGQGGTVLKNAHKGLGECLVLINTLSDRCYGYERTIKQLRD